MRKKRERESIYLQKGQVPNASATMSDFDEKKRKKHHAKRYLKKKKTEKGN
jgi:hypothetical protein